jgi:serine/threonine-protein kinase RsbW
LAEENYSLEIGSNPNNLITVEEFVNYFAKDIGISEERMNGLMLSVTEATTNAIIHANKCDESKFVKINVKVEAKKVIISVKDEGIGFDPSKIPNPTEPENLLKDSGRGVYLMRFYMDDIKYNITKNGTELILILNLDNQAQSIS